MGAGQCVELGFFHAETRRRGEKRSNQAIRTKELRIRLPRHHVDMLEYRAEREQITVSDALARELDGVASAHAEREPAMAPC
jgi:hypothetical protein